MKKILIFILSILSTTIWADIALYTTDSLNPHPVTDLYSIMHDFASQYKDKNILFYVHGRKKHMIDEWKKLPKMEAKYNVKVVMLHWDSYDTLVSRPTKNAETTADYLYESLEQIKKFKEDHPAFYQEHKVNLLCHSMGNLILKNMIEKYYSKGEAQEELFTNYVSVGADVPLKNHRVWLSKFKMAKQNYIMMNNRDIVLLLSYLLDLKEQNPLSYRLGLGFDNYIGWRDNVKNKLVETTKYIDLSKVLEGDHGYYMGKSEIMLTIFNRLLNGEDFASDDKTPDQFKYVQDLLDKNLFYVQK